MRLSRDKALPSSIIALLVACASCKQHRIASVTIDRNGPVEVRIPEGGVYTGAFIDFGDAEDEVALEMVEDFEQMVGKHQAIVASSSYWGEQSFPMANLKMIWRHGAMPLVYWSPWDKPYEQNRGPDKFNLNTIIDGVWDSYIDKWADAAREFGRPMIVAFGLK